MNNQPKVRHCPCGRDACAPGKTRSTAGTLSCDGVVNPTMRVLTQGRGNNASYGKPVDQCPSIPSWACLPHTCWTRESRPQENR